MGATVVSTLAGAPWGGSEILWAEAAARLARSGADVTAVTLHRRERVPGHAALTDAGVHLTTWKRAGRLRRAYLKARPAAGPEIGTGPLLVNMASAHDLVQAVLPRALVRRAVATGRPYVLAPHSLIERRLTQRNRALLRELYSRAAAVVVPSTSLADDLERQLAAHLPRAVEIPTSTPLLGRPPSPWPPEGPLRLACVARIDVEQKGHDALLAALGQVSWRDEPWSLDVYGSGPDEGYVAELVDFYGLADHVRLRGHATDIAAVWAGAHVLVMPSRREARGIAITEAMAAGRPVVGTAIGGIPDSVIDGETGLLAASPTPRGLAGALEELWQRRDQLEAWGSAARSRMERLFAVDPVERLVDLLVELDRD